MELGDFTLEAQLHMGRMTEVWRARWHKAPTPQHHTVALKIIRTDALYDQKLLQRFVNEINTARRLQHTNIAAPLSYGQFADGRVYFVTQFIEGHPLRRWMGRPLPLDFALSVLAQIAEGLDAVHRAGVVHRDVKPDNIMISPQGTPYLLDFNVALSEEAKRVTELGDLVGTTLYMAPEMIAGEVPGRTGPSAISAQTDVYALGITAYEMITGHPPFQGNAYQVTYQHMYNAPAVPSTLNPTLPAAVDSVIAQALMKQPPARYPSATAFIAALQQAAGFPVTVRRGADLNRYLPVLVGGVIVFLLLLFVVLLG